MAKARTNDTEQDILEAAEDYVEMVHEVILDLAPEGPFWSPKLSPDAKLFRYMEVRDKIMPWIAVAGAYMGYKDDDDLLNHLGDLWMSEKLVDLVPKNVIDALPVELVEMVQAAPKDAAKHIRDMERLFQARAAAYARVQEEQIPEVSEIGEPPQIPEEAE